MDQSFKQILRLKNPLRIFDLVCLRNYFAGRFDLNVPVDDSRKAFERIKKLIQEDSK